MVTQSLCNKGLPDTTALWDITQLQKQDAIARQRAEGFIRAGIPNREECNLLEKLLRNHHKELHSFPYLFLYEWTPSTMPGQGDVVFANAQGGLVVVEAKAKSAKSHVTRQSLFYRQRLVDEYPCASVSAAILTNAGFDWIERAPQESSTKPLPSSDVQTISDASAPWLDDEQISKKKKENSGSAPFAVLAPSLIDQLESMVVDKEIKPILRFYGLKVFGRKADLIERIFIPDEWIK
eukprot:scaffold574_cov190-Amphora_coffeaeformis.AAC.14